MNLYLGANAKNQAICFLFCLLVGLAGGLFALLYLRKAKPLERALTDFFATVCISGAFIACVEWIMQGKIQLYGVFSFGFGVFIPPFLFSKIRNHVRKREKKTNKVYVCRPASNCTELC